MPFEIVSGGEDYSEKLTVEMGTEDIILHLEDTYHIVGIALTRSDALALAAHLTGLASTILRDQEEAARK